MIRFAVVAVKPGREQRLRIVTRGNRVLRKPCGLLSMTDISDPSER
jgi:hypothetical protein